VAQSSERGSRHHGDWAVLYQDLLAELGRILEDPADGQIRGHLHSLLTEHRARRPASRAELIRAPVLSMAYVRCAHC